MYASCLDMKSAAAHMCHKIDECITFITLKKLLLTRYSRQERRLRSNFESALIHK